MRICLQESKIKLNLQWNDVAHLNLVIKLD